MSPFEKVLDEFVELAPGIRRLLAPNPSLMTGPGTNTYLLGKTSIAVVDPGPALEDHLARIVECARAPICWILATHTHPDHSPGVAALANLTGAEVLGMRPPRGQHQDPSFAPDRELANGSLLETSEFTLEAIHTPGHASNHLCYLHVDANWILTGDHIIEGSTVVIDPPDGNMCDYLASLQVVRARRPDALLPGHGALIDEPARVIDGIIEHRMARERRVLTVLAARPGSTAAALVPHVYTDVPERLHGWAERSLLAHLIKLAEDGVATERAGQWRIGHPLPLA